MQVPSFLSHSLLVQPELHRFVQSSPQYFGSHAETNITRVLIRIPKELFLLFKETKMCFNKSLELKIHQYGHIHIVPTKDGFIFAMSAISYRVCEQDCIITEKDTTRCLIYF